MKKYSIFALYLSVCCVFLFSTTGQAYIDPSTTTYIIQAVAGVAIAISAFVMVYWRKAKKKVEQTLHIDTEAHKTMEEDLIVTDDVVNCQAEDQL